jgi:prevent-host-death family protein
VTRVSATEAARSFSDVLNRVAAGEEFEVTRSGAPVATLSPARRTVLSAQRFRALVATAPTQDEGFAAELAAIRAGVGPPDELVWPS